MRFINILTYLLTYMMWRLKQPHNGHEGHDATWRGYVMSVMTILLCRLESRDWILVGVHNADCFDSLAWLIRPVFMSRSSRPHPAVKNVVTAEGRGDWSCRLRGLFHYVPRNRKYRYYTVFQKNDTDVTHYRFNPHQPISVIFGRDVAERVRYWMVIYYPTSPN